MRFYFADDRDIDAFIAADDTIEAQEQKIQTSRVQAWAAVRNNERKMRIAFQTDSKEETFAAGAATSSSSAQWKTWKLPPLLHRRQGYCS